MRTEVVYDMPEEVYHGDPLLGVVCLSSSIAATLVMKSPAHAAAEHPLLRGEAPEPSDAMTEGAILDALLLGGKRIVEIPYDDFRKKDAQEERDAALAAGCIPVISRKLTKYDLCVDRIKRSIFDDGFDLDKGHKQVTVFWVETADSGVDVQCKARFDVLQGDLIADLKKARSAHPATLAKHIISYGYDIQCVAYMRAALKAGLSLTPTFQWLFVEADVPYAVTIAQASGALLKYGELRWRRAVNLWAQCLQNKSWPAYEKGPHRVELPAWAMTEEMIAEVEDGRE
jgi:hypothetical protein